MRKIAVLRLVNCRIGTAKSDPPPHGTPKHGASSSDGERFKRRASWDGHRLCLAVSARSRTSPQRQLRKTMLALAPGQYCAHAGCALSERASTRAVSARRSSSARCQARKRPQNRCGWERAWTTPGGRRSGVGTRAGGCSRRAASGCRSSWRGALGYGAGGSLRTANGLTPGLGLKSFPGYGWSREMWPKQSTEAVDLARKALEQEALALAEIHAITQLVSVRVDRRSVTDKNLLPYIVSRCAQSLTLCMPTRCKRDLHHTPWPICESHPETPPARSPRARPRLRDKGDRGQTRQLLCVGGRGARAERCVRKP